MENKVSLILKLCIKSVFVVLCIIGCIFLPKSVMTKKQVYKVLTPIVNVEDSNLVLYDYKVYSVKEKFDKALTEEVEQLNEEFINDNNYLIVKIPGEKKIEYKDYYIQIADPSVPDLNMEFYVAKNVKTDDFNLPITSIMSLVENPLKAINGIYTTVFTLLFFTLISAPIVRIYRIVKKLIKIKQETE